MWKTTIKRVWHLWSWLKRATSHTENLRQPPCNQIQPRTNPVRCWERPSGWETAPAMYGFKQSNVKWWADIFLKRDQKTQTQPNEWKCANKYSWNFYKGILGFQQILVCVIWPWAFVMTVITGILKTEETVEEMQRWGVGYDSKPINNQHFCIIQLELKF